MSTHGTPYEVGRAERDGGADGFVTPAFVLTVGLTMVLLVAVANVLVVDYAEGVLQAAVEEGVRQGAALGTPAACAARVRHVIDAGLGTMASEVGEPRCTVTPAGAAATLTAAFAGWVPVVPDRDVTATSRTAATVTAGPPRHGGR